VAELDGQLLGWTAGFGSIKSDNPWGRVYALAIRPEARGRKLGERLLRHMIETLAQRGAKRIFLEVRPDNHPAVRLYEKHGFAVCQRLEHFYGPGAAAQRMRLDLPPLV
jgi:ribosomal-protein-alanine N-acetyltransferase